MSETTPPLEEVVGPDHSDLPFDILLVVLGEIGKRKLSNRFFHTVKRTVVPELSSYFCLPSLLLQPSFTLSSSFPENWLHGFKFSLDLLIFIETTLYSYLVSPYIKPLSHFVSPIRLPVSFLKTRFM